MYSIVTDFADLASTGEHGAALSAALTEVLKNASLHVRHLGLILGLYNIYSVLKAVGYLREEDIAWPPHHQRNDFDADAWAGEGLSAEAQSVLGFLTCPSSDLFDHHIIPIFAPYVSAQLFTGPPDHDIRDPRYQDDEALRLPAECFKLSPGGEDPVLVYDVSQGRAGWWDLMATDWSGQEAVQMMDWQPAADLLNSIAKSLLDLDLVPVPIVNLPAFEASPEESEVEPPQRETRPPHLWYVNNLNRFRAQQQIYRSHGWPGPTYRQEEAVAAIQQCHAVCDELEVPFQGQEEYDFKTQREAAEKYWRFLKDTAGTQAVVRPSFEELSDPWCARLRDL